MFENNFVGNKEFWFSKKKFFPETPLSDYATSISTNMALVNNNVLFKNEDQDLPLFNFIEYFVLMILNVFLLIIGLFLHSAAAIILTVPIVMPLVNAVGIDPVHFGIIVTLNLAIGQQTPPVASVLVTACSVAKADIWDVTRANIMFIGVLLFLLLVVTYIPAVPMTLVEYFYRS